MLIFLLLPMCDPKYSENKNFVLSCDDSMIYTS